MHGNEIMNIFILNSDLVSFRSTSMTHWEQTERGGLLMLIQCLLDISFCADIYSVFVVYCLFDVDCVWACAFYSHVSVCVLALRKKLSRQ